MDRFNIASPSDHEVNGESISINLVRFIREVINVSIPAALAAYMAQHEARPDDEAEHVTVANFVREVMNKAVSKALDELRVEAAGEKLLRFIDNEINTILPTAVAAYMSECDHATPAESGRADLYAEDNSARPGDLVDLVEKYKRLRCTGTRILDLPDDVLREIILLLTARERVPLGDSCRRFRSFVFKDPVLLRDLDFSKRACLVTLTEIQRFFHDEDACQHVRRVNANGVACLVSGTNSLDDTVGRAFNLREVNVWGFPFYDLWQMGNFLHPLRHLKKLTIDWPSDEGIDRQICERNLERPLSRLRSLSVNIQEHGSAMFTRCLYLCKQLEELRIMCRFDNGLPTDLLNNDIRRLTHLKIIHYRGYEAIKIKEKLVTLIPDPKRWTDFELCGPHISDELLEEFYIEKDVEVCNELQQSSKLDEILSTAPSENFSFKWAVNPGCLLKEALRITHQDVPEDLCCLSTCVSGWRHLLNVKEAKMLLKDPRYQISYLYLNHDLEKHCDAHLLASALPNLSELHLPSITENLPTTLRDSCFRRRLRKRGSPVLEQQDDLPSQDSPFKLLVENTPNLRHFTLDPHYGLRSRIDHPNKDALHLIAGWKHLETLRVRDVPDENPECFIEIGKRCQNLQQISLIDVTGSSNVALCQMVACCRNLRDLDLSGCGIDQAQMFASLVKNGDLERVVMNDRTQHSAAPWISSLENMVRKCEKLRTIICVTSFRSEDDMDEAVIAVFRIKREVRRPDFQMEADFTTHSPRHRRQSVPRVFEDYQLQGLQGVEPFYVPF